MCLYSFIVVTKCLHKLSMVILNLAIASGFIIGGWVGVFTVSSMTMAGELTVV